MSSPVHFLNLQYFFNLIYRILTAPLSWFGGVPVWLMVIWGGLYFIFWLIILVLAFKIVQQRDRESHDLHLMLASKASEEKPAQNERWQKVLKYLESNNPAEWKLAIIEADTMLDDLVKNLQPQGENLGERLKAIDPADFHTLQEAWEAHKVRNKIAHEHNYAPSKTEVLRTIANFKKVFDEFQYL